MADTTIHALALWAGLHTLLMLGLALNVTRHRFKSGTEGYDERRLERAIRAHGNNIEYVPIILLGVALLAFLGVSSVWVHFLCAVLLLARCLHAHGIQQEAPLPASRVAGNLGTWSVMLITALALVYLSAVA